MGDIPKAPVDTMSDAVPSLSSPSLFSTSQTLHPPQTQTRSRPSSAVTVQEGVSPGIITKAKLSALVHKAPQGLVPTSVP